MCFFKKKPQPVIPLPPVIDTPPVPPEPLPVPELETILLERQGFLNIMKNYGIEPISMATPLDASVRFASKQELDRIAPYLVYPAEWYINELWDCENFGMQAANDAGRIFEISVFLGLGNMPLGYHGFAVTLDRDLNLWLLEPNAGFEYAGRWFQKGENSYSPDKVFV
jgi:hypothetical protein